MYQYGVMVVLLLTLVGQVDGLKCFKCSSLLDSKCHIDWEVTDSDAEKFAVECNPSAKACQKIVGEIQGSGVQHVYRQCWNHTTMEDYTPTGCEEDEIRGSVVCRCASELCNGQRRLEPSGAIYVTFLLFGDFLRQLSFLKFL